MSKRDTSKPAKYEVPKAVGMDRARTVVRAVTSAVPYIGGPLAELTALVASPLEKRRDAWAEEVAEGLRKLEATVAGFSIDELKNSDAFASAVAQAVPAVLRTHDAEKLEALRNAVLNTALEAPSGYDTGALISILESLTPWHLKVLCFLGDPGEYFDASRTPVMSRSQALETAFPALRGNRNTYDSLVRDLYLQGLSTIDSLHVTMTSSGVLASCLTPKGEALVQLVRSPIA